MNICTRACASRSLFSAASASVMTLICQPVSSLASRTFCPPRPMACESWCSGTATSAVRVSSSSTIDTTSAGDMALMMNCAGFSSHRMMSMRSPASSFETDCTREPRMPTQAPTGSMRGSLERTAILAREPGSRAAPTISTSPCPASGTSSLKSSISSSGRVRLQKSWGPRGSERTS